MNLERKGEGWTYKGFTTQTLREADGHQLGDVVINAEGLYFGEDGTWGEDYRARYFMSAKAARRALVMIAETGKFQGSYFI